MLSILAALYRRERLNIGATVHSSLLETAVSWMNVGLANYAAEGYEGSRHGSAIAVMDSKRSNVLPDVPTFAELGMEDMNSPWLGIFVPAGTPQAVIQKLNHEFGEALKDPELLNSLDQHGIMPVGGSSSSFAKMIEAELESNQKLIAETGIKAD